MKKIFVILLALSLITACNNETEETTTSNEIYYSGRLTVNPIRDATQISTQENIEFSLQGAQNGTLTLWMYKTAFVQGMPPLTMVVPNISWSAEDKVISLLGDRIIPSVGNTPYEKYMITTLKGEVRDAQLTISFDCIGHHVAYQGTETSR